MREQRKATETVPLLLRATLALPVQPVGMPTVRVYNELR
jgi:hypothetical protein